MCENWINNCYHYHILSSFPLTTMPSCKPCRIFHPGRCTDHLIVAELKQKAVKAKDTTVEKVQNTKDRHTSVPMKSTNWNPYDGSAPKPPPPPRVHSNSRPTPPPTFPPPPSRTSSTQSSASASSGPTPPPVVSRSTRPSASQIQRLNSQEVDSPQPPPSRSSVRSFAKPKVPSAAQHSGEIDWANLSQEDKEIFFSWLDEFFDRSFNIPPPVRSSSF